jgi:Fic family protein
MYVRKEAVLSSQIEGTQSSLSDLLLFELQAAPGVPLDDVVEVSNYVSAMQYGLKRLKDGFPISSRLLREIHLKLLAKGRGSDKQPGEFRRSQNWIGGTRPGNARFVPPPPDKVAECMGDWEKFVHDQPEKTSALVKAALAHVQFETIHPFLDGNGRVGRLFITLLFCAENILREPLLYLSVYFKKHREQYYELLQQVRTQGDWETWLDFFAKGVRETAEAAVQTAKKLVDLFEQDRQHIQTLEKIAGSALRIHAVLQKKPIVSIAKAAQNAKLSVPAATSALQALMRLKLVEELTGNRRNRIFAYKKYLRLLNEGTERI